MLEKYADWATPSLLESPASSTTIGSRWFLIPAGLCAHLISQVGEQRIRGLVGTSHASIYDPLIWTGDSVPTSLARPQLDPGK
jgi:hypothetical protein